MDGQNVLNCNSMELAPKRLHASILVQTDQWTSGVSILLWSNLLRAVLPLGWKPCRQVCKSPKKTGNNCLLLPSFATIFCSPGSKRVHYCWILHLWYWVLFCWASGLYCCTVSSLFSHCSSGYAWFTHLLSSSFLSFFLPPSLLFPFPSLFFPLLISLIVVHCGYL